MIRITIIEDLPIILEGTRALINLIDDFEVVYVFSNGQEFMDNIDEIDTDIILIDIDMPILDGVTTTKMALSSFPQLKFIALSMHNAQKHYYEMITAGAKGFVLKQSSVEDLEIAIREVDKGSNFFSKELLHGVILEMQGIEKKIIEEKTNYFKLTEREKDLLIYACQGLSNKELADKLLVSKRTIESTKARLMQKTYTKNTAGLIIWAIKNKIVEM